MVHQDIALTKQKGEKLFLKKNCFEKYCEKIILFSKSKRNVHDLNPDPDPFFPMQIQDPDPH